MGLLVLPAERSCPGSLRGSRRKQAAGVSPKPPKNNNRGQYEQGWDTAPNTYATGIPLTSRSRRGRGLETPFRATFAGSLLVKIEAVCLDADIQFQGFEPQAVCQEPFA